MWKFNRNTLSLVNCANASNGEIGFCYCNICSENEGDCNAHDECLDGLACGSNNCPISLGFDSGIDCCYPNVNCGGHSADFCHECPNGNGASWCNGDCEWNLSINECQLKSIGYTTSISATTITTTAITTSTAGK